MKSEWKKNLHHCVAVDLDGFSAKLYSDPWNSEKKRTLLRKQKSNTWRWRRVRRIEAGLPFFHSLAASRKHTSVWSPSAPLAWPPSTGGGRNKDGQRTVIFTTQYSRRQAVISNFLLSLEQHWWSDFPAINTQLQMIFLTVQSAVCVWGSKAKFQGCKINIIKRWDK